MEDYVVAVTYRVRARDGQDAIHRASAYQISRQYHEDVEEIDCTVSKIITIVCAWCNRQLHRDGEWGPRTEEGQISHGICPECAEKNHSKDVDHRQSRS